MFSRFTVFVSWCVILVGSASGLWAQSNNPPATGEGGHQLPAPFGIGMTVYSQSQAYDLARLDLDLEGVDISVAESLPVDNRTESYHLKFDYWALPFVNVFAIAGKLETTTTVRLSGIDLGLPFTLGNMVIENDGWVYGGGLTLAGGYDDFFVTVTGTYTEADLEVTSSSVEALTIIPKVGYVVGKAGFWVGAMYQDAEERHGGVYEIPYFGEFPFSVELHEAERWNYQVGAVGGLSEHWLAILELGFGDRDSAMLSLEYRF